MMQMRTHTCGELRLADAGKSVKIVGWMENVLEVGSNFAFVVLRDFYGTTQVVIESEEMMAIIRDLNKESTISVEGVVRQRATLRWSPARSRCWAAAATTACPLRSTAAGRPTRPSA